MFLNDLEISGKKEMARQAREWWDALLERLLVQEEIEDYYYEYRTECDMETGKRYVCHMYPLWWAVYYDKMDVARRLWEKGYSLGYRKEGEAVSDVRYLLPKNEREREYSGIHTDTVEQFFEIYFVRKLVDGAVEADEETAGWFAARLEELWETLDGEMSDNIVSSLRRMTCVKQEERAYSEEQEKWLDGLHDRLPRFYHRFFADGNFWYDIDFIKCRTTMGIGSFPLLKRYWEYCESPENAEEKKIYLFMENDAKSEREQLWEIILDWTAEKCLSAAVQSVYYILGGTEAYHEERVEEYNALAERMHGFFLGYCREDALRESYQKSLERMLASCKEWLQKALSQQEEEPLPKRQELCAWLEEWERGLEQKRKECALYGK